MAESDIGPSKENLEAATSERRTRKTGRFMANLHMRNGVSYRRQATAVESRTGTSGYEIPLHYFGCNIGNLSASCDDLSKISCSYPQRISRRKILRRVYKIPREGFMDYHKKAALLFAGVYGDNYDCVMRWLLTGFNPNCREKGTGKTPLTICAERKNVAMAELLINYGASPNSRDRSGSTPLHIASVVPDLSMVSLLLNNGADPKKIDGNGANAFHLAARKLKYLKLYTKEPFSESKQVVMIIQEYLKRSKHQNTQLNSLIDILDKKLTISDAPEKDIDQDIDNLVEAFEGL